MTDTSYNSNNHVVPSLEPKLMSIISPLLVTKPTFKESSLEHKELIRKIRQFDPIETAGLVAGLLTEPTCAANTFRLEFFVHIALIYAKGKNKPDVARLSRWLNKDLGATHVASLEDPMEDVFISNITHKTGNYRIFEGIWESNDFFLQRILNVIDTLPESANTIQLQREVRALLTLSEEIAKRRSLPRYCSGSGIDKGPISLPAERKLYLMFRALTFSNADLEKLGVLRQDLSPFFLTKQHRNLMLSQTNDCSCLNYHPLVEDSLQIYVMLPAALSIAIRVHVLNWMHSHGYTDSFNRYFVAEYSEIIKATPILGKTINNLMPLPASFSKEWGVFEIIIGVDRGCFLHVLAIVDTLSTFKLYGINKISNHFKELNDLVEKKADDARLYCAQQNGYRNGLTLVVHCGFGRPYIIGIPTTPLDWPIQAISAPDLCTMGWLPKSEPLLLLKQFEHERIIEKIGVTLIYSNGILNLYGWWSDTDFMMYPHDMQFDQVPMTLVIPTNCLEKVRQEVREAWDVRMLPHPRKGLILVRRMYPDSYFCEKKREPRYICFDAAREGALLCAWIGEHYVWWIQIDKRESIISTKLSFQIWDCIANWLGKVIQLLENKLKLNTEAILVTVDIRSLNDETAHPTNIEECASAISIVIENATYEMQLLLSDPLIGAFRQPKNIAERALVKALIKGIMTLGKQPYYEEDVENILQQIMPNEDARYLHIYEVRTFRELAYDHVGVPLLLIEDADVGLSKLGLGWLGQKDTIRKQFYDISESCTFLNEVVDKVWARIRELLWTIDKVYLIKDALLYIEKIEHEVSKWMRTFRALSALPDLSAPAEDVAIRQIARYNIGLVAFRIIIEMAVCECPLKGASLPTRLEVSRLISDAALIFYLGGCSDAIRKGVMDPMVEIAPCGNVLTDSSFRNEIAERLVKEYESKRLQDAIEDYVELFEPLETRQDVSNVFSADFLNAFKDEICISLDDFRNVLTLFQELCLTRQVAVLILTEEEICEFCRQSCPSLNDAVREVLTRFSLWPRSTWDLTPPGFNKKDWAPWRFRRKLSLVSRPLIRLDEGANPRYVVSPGLFETSLLYIVRCYERGEVETTDCQSREMRQWVEKSKAARSHSFVQSVSKAMSDHGYLTRIEQPLTALLRENLSADYGDVDVLAWKKGGVNIYAIECKALRLAKTPNDIAEQLNRFNGGYVNRKKDELRKHIDRCYLLQKKVVQLSETLGMDRNDICVKNIVCFSNIVPMRYVAFRFPDVKFLTINELKTALKLGDIS